MFKCVARLFFIFRLELDFGGPDGSCNIILITITHIIFIFIGIVIVGITTTNISGIVYEIIHTVSASYQSS